MELTVLPPLPSSPFLSLHLILPPPAVQSFLFSPALLSVVRCCLPSHRIHVFTGKPMNSLFFFAYKETPALDFTVLRDARTNCLLCNIRKFVFLLSFFFCHKSQLEPRTPNKMKHSINRSLLLSDVCREKEEKGRGI